MTVREVKFWLQQYRHTQKEIRDIELRITQLRLQYGAPSAINYNDMPHAHNPRDLSAFYVKLEEYENLLIDKHTKAIGLTVQIYQAIDKLTDSEERHVLRRKYLDNAHWSDIAEEIPCSDRTVYYIHGRALLHLAETLQ